MVTGSSSLDLARGVKESLTGRNQTYRLFPLSTVELTGDLAPHEKPSLLPEQLIFGGYPYLLQLQNPVEKHDYMRSIVEDYLFRDILALKEIEAVDKLRQLGALLAFQVGSEVSLSELAQNLKLATKTVARLLSLLSESFVIFPLSSFSTNPRKEIAKGKKYYFWDLGIRNALVDQFTPLNDRGDKGQLWENFLAVERLKRDEYAKIGKQYFFWRTYAQSEVDWIELQQGKIDAFEFKWNKGFAKSQRAFQSAHGEKVIAITKENYLDFVS